MSQDPGDNDTIQNFCQVNYGVSFPVLGKTEVNGENAEPLFEYLKGQAPGLFGMKRVKWNFEKFLVGKDGSVVRRWASTTKPESLESVVLEEIQKASYSTSAYISAQTSLPSSLAAFSILARANPNNGTPFGTPLITARATSTFRHIIPYSVPT
ncbi:MAG: hypothetical protein Q9184_007935 [Pyrenodesmia sp. 2 TL-2023]